MDIKGGIKLSMKKWYLFALLYFTFLIALKFEINMISDPALKQFGGKNGHLRGLKVR